MSSLKPVSDDFHLADQYYLIQTACPRYHLKTFLWKVSWVMLLALVGSQKDMTKGKIPEYHTLNHSTLIAKVCYRDHLLYKSINLLLDLTLIKLMFTLP